MRITYVDCIRKIFRAVFMVVLSILLLIFIAIAFQATLPLLDYLIGSRHDLIEFILWFVCAAGSLLFAILIWDAASAWSAPADSPDKRDWREVFEFRKRWRDYKERRRLYNAPEPPPTSTCASWATLPPWPKRRKEGIAVEALFLPEEAAAFSACVP